MAKQQMQTIPYSLEAEQCVLGSVLIDLDLQSEIVTKLKTEDFYVEAHKHIYNAMAELVSEGKTIDFVTLVDFLSKTPAYVKNKSEKGNEELINALESKSMLDRVGGIDYITELSSKTPSAANYESYLEIVQRDSVLRKLIKASQNIEKDAFSSADHRNSLSYAEKLIYDISENIDTTSLTNINENVKGVLELYENIQADKNFLQGLYTGYIGFDDATNGLHKGNLIILAARPSVGKTTLAMNIVENVAMRHGAVCAVFALEMTKQELTERMISSIAGVSGKRAKQGKLKNEDWKKYWDAQNVMANCKIFIDDTSMTTVPEILSKCRRLKAQQSGKLDLIVVDHIQLMNSVKTSESRQAEITEISRGLKMIAKTLDVPVIALSQLSRDSEKGKRKPQLSDLRDSGAIEQDADIVMFIHRADRVANDKNDEVLPQSRAEADIIIAKNRQGECSTFKLLFKGEESKFVNISFNPPQAPAYMEKKEENEDATTNESVDTKTSDIDDGYDNGYEPEPPAEENYDSPFVDEDDLY